MGTDVEVTVLGPSRLARQALARIADLEARWSRFRDTSEVSALNLAGGQPVAVSAPTRLLVARAVEAWDLSAGFVDCTLLHEVVAAGYDRSFDEIPADRPAPDRHLGGLRLVGPGDITVGDGTVTLPPGVGFDPGGIGKGLAADIVADEMMDDGAEGVCIDLGGDLRMRGVGPDGGAWTISVDHPHQPVPLALVGIGDGAVASSTTLRRRWRMGGRVHHHLIDPGTGRPAESTIAFATVVAGDAWTAETLAKAILVRGGEHPFDLVDGTAVEALTVDVDGTVRTSDGFVRFTGGVVPPPSVQEVA